MEVKKIWLEYMRFDSDSMNELQTLAADNCKLEDAPRADEHKNPRKRREQSFVARDLLTALAVCHNVTPVQMSSTNNINSPKGGSNPEKQY